MAIQYIVVILAYPAALLVVACLAFLFPKDAIVPAVRANSLDGLRGILAVGVMCHHFIISMAVLHGSPWESPATSFFNNIGKIPVNIFFMITGYLFCPVILNKPAHTDWKRFFIKRFMRIVPLMWLVIFLVAITAFFVSDHHRLTWSTIESIIKWMLFIDMPDMFGVANTAIIIAGVAWTLRWEWVFYISLLPLSYIFSKTRPSVIIVSLVMVGLLIMSATQLLHLELLNGHKLHFPLLFALGMLAHVLVKREFAQRLVTDWAFGALIFVLQVIALALLSDAYNPLAFVISFCLLVTICSGNKFYALLSFKSALLIGEASYSIYLLHGIMLYLFFHLFGNKLVRTWGEGGIALCLPLIVTLVTIISLASYKNMKPTSLNWVRKYEWMPDFSAKCLF